MKMTKHYKFKLVAAVDETIHEEVIDFAEDSQPRYQMEKLFPFPRVESRLIKQRKDRTETVEGLTAGPVSEEELLRLLPRFIERAVAEQQGTYIRIVPVEVPPPPDPVAEAKRMEHEAEAKKNREEAEARKKQERESAKEKKERAQLERLQTKYGKEAKSGP